jgi:hypothetical protein
MRVSKSGDRTGFQAREVDPEVGQTEQIAKRTLVSAGYA